MAATASRGGMIPEQIWDADAIPQKRLLPGRPSGSAMPLVWAHAEFIKLVVSRELGYPFDRPEALWKRYKGLPKRPDCAFWWPHARLRSAPAGSRIVIALTTPGVIHWGRDGWQAITETAAEETGLGFYAAVLDTAELSMSSQIEFTVRGDEGGWIGTDYVIEIDRGTRMTSEDSFAPDA
jgi:glucoamylase